MKTQDRQMTTEQARNVLMHHRDMLYQQEHNITIDKIANAIDLAVKALDKELICSANKNLIELTDKYIGHPEEIDEGLETYMRRKAYQDGMIDQQRMDIAVIEQREKELIEKACKWIGSLAEIEGTDYLMTDQNPMREEIQLDVEAMISDFIEYMED